MVSVSGAVLGGARPEAGAAADGGPPPDRRGMRRPRAGLLHHTELQEEPQLQRAGQVLRRGQSRSAYLLY